MNVIIPCKSIVFLSILSIDGINTSYFLSNSLSSAFKDFLSLLLRDSYSLDFTADPDDFVPYYRLLSRHPSPPLLVDQVLVVKHGLTVDYLELVLRDKVDFNVSLHLSCELPVHISKSDSTLISFYELNVTVTVNVQPDDDVHWLLCSEPLNIVCCTLP